MLRLLSLALLLVFGACSSGDQTLALGPPASADSRIAAGSIAFEDSVHALVVFVRFEDDTSDAPEWDIEGRAGLEVVPDWGLDLFKEDPDDVRASMGIDDPSLSAYFFWQSQGGPGRAHILTGEVWPREERRPHVYTPSRPSSAYASGRGQGYGFLIQEVLDDLAEQRGFDFGRFDANRDGELDHLMLIVRRDPAVPVVGGVAALEGVTNARVRTSGAPSRTLTYPSSQGEITVDLSAFGSGTINWVGGERSVRTLVHEYGHVLLDQGHTAMIQPTGLVSNDVPFDVPSGTGAFACQYNRMCGGGSGGGRPTESSNYDATLTLSGFELRRLGWANRTVLEADRDTTVLVRPLYGSGDVVLVPLRTVSGADTLSFESRHRTNPFDAFPPLDYDDPFYGLVYRDLPTEGLLATLSHGDPTGPAGRYRYDFVPPSNRLVQAGSRCDGTSEGCTSPYSPWDGDMYRPGGTTQITPWTRPNVSGYTMYPEGFEPNWFAVTTIRYTGRDREMALDLDADVRTGGFDITADSWMGAETSGTRFSDPIRVLEGATLRVWQDAEVAFDGGLEVETGARFVCETGARCTVRGEPALEVK